MKEQTVYLLIPDVIATMFCDRYDLLSLTKRYKKHINQLVILVLNLSLYLRLEPFPLNLKLHCATTDFHNQTD